MNTVEVIEESNNRLTFSINLSSNAYSNRKFTVSLDKNFPKYFSKLNLNKKEIIIRRLKEFEFAFTRTSSDLRIGFYISNGSKGFHYDLECEEIFMDAVLDQNSDNVSNTELKI